MPAKMIFYIHPETGEETMQFCPLVKFGCDKCFLKGCNGENDPNIAFRLDLAKKPYSMTAISNYQLESDADKPHSSA